MERITILGMGKIGKLYSWIIRKNFPECTLIIIDPQLSDASNEIFDLPDDVIKAQDLFIVSSPTSSHLKIIEEISKININSKIIVEKPICSLSELDKLDSLIQNGEISKNIVINDNYSNSTALHVLKDKISSFDCIDKISINFSKNRLLDMKNGRFIDKEVGVLGYEFFHIISILFFLLEKRELKNIIDSIIDYTCADFRVDIEHDYGTINLSYEFVINNIVVSLVSSVDGYIIDNNKFKKISYGSKENYRRIQVFSKNEILQCIFEYDYLGHNYKNRHNIIKKLDNISDPISIEIKENIFEKSFFNNINLLFNDNNILLEKNINRSILIMEILLIINDAISCQVNSFIGYRDEVSYA